MLRCFLIVVFSTFCSLLFISDHIFADAPNSQVQVEEFTVVQDTQNKPEPHGLKDNSRDSVKVSAKKLTTDASPTTQPELDNQTKQVVTDAEQGESETEKIPFCAEKKEKLLKVSAEPQMKDGKYLTLRTGKHSATYHFLGAQGSIGTDKPVDVTTLSKEGKIIHQDVVPGLTLENTVHPSMVKEDLILSHYQGHNTYHFGIQTDLEAKQNVNGSIDLVDSKGKVIFHLPKPYMIDSYINPESEEPSRSENVSYSIKKEDDLWVLSVIADDAWLQDPLRQYPVRVDPTTIVKTSVSSGDTFVSSSYPTTNYERYKESGYHPLKVGYYDQSSGYNLSLLKQDISKLNGVIVDRATLHVLTAHSSQPTPTRVWLDAVAEPWDASKVTWNHPIRSVSVGHADVCKGQWATFDVTNVVQAWLDGEPNHGFMLHTDKQGKTHWKKFYSSDNAGKEPYLSITYHAALPEDPSQDLGVQGYRLYAPVLGGKVNAVTGNFIHAERDGRVSGMGSGILLERTYNSCSKADGPFGTGWSFNLDMHLKEEANGNVLFTDSDGTKFSFVKNANGTYTSPLGVTLCLKKLASGYTIADKGQAKAFFTISGKLTKIQDTNKNAITLEYSPANQLIAIKDVSKRKTTLEYNAKGKIISICTADKKVWKYGYKGNRLSSVTDPEGEILRYDYTAGLLTQIQEPNHTDAKPAKVSYVYENGRLSKVIDSRSNTTILSYDPAQKKMVVQNPKGIKTELFYNHAGNPAKVVVDPTGLKIVSTYRYSKNQLVELKDPNMNQLGKGTAASYLYDSKGNIIQAKDHTGTHLYKYDQKDNVTRHTDAKGHSTKYRYNGIGNEVTQTNKDKTSDVKIYDSRGNIVSSTSDLGMGNNVLFNSRFEKKNLAIPTLPLNWTKEGDKGAVSLDGSAKVSGNQCVKITPKSTKKGERGYIALIQDVPVEPNQTYTLSGMVKALDLKNAKAFFNTLQLDTNRKAIKGTWADNRHSKLTGTRKWTKRQVTFTTKPTTSFVRVYLEVELTKDNPEGAAWFDHIQLEKGAVSSSYNPVENSAFDQGLTSWYKSSGNPTIDTKVFFDGKQSAKLTRSKTTEPLQQLSQSFDLHQQKAEPITLTGMSKAVDIGNAVENAPNDSYGMVIDAIDIDGNYHTKHIQFPMGSHKWQRHAVTVVPSKPIRQVKVYLRIGGNNKGTVHFDNIRVLLGRAITNHEYDARGNVVKTTDPLGCTSHFTYDNSGNVLTSTDPKSNTKAMSYDKNNRLLSQEFAGEDVKVNYHYDKNGNMIKKVVMSKDGRTIYNQMSYEYDENSQLVKVIDPLNREISYMYDEMGNEIKVTQQNGSTIESVYDAANRKVAETINQKVRYKYAYDANGNETRVDDVKLKMRKSRTFDAANRVVKMDAGGGQQAWDYDENSNYTKHTITHEGKGYVHQYKYNAMDQNTTVTNPQGKSTRFDYDESGDIVNFIHGNGSGSTFVNDDNGRVTHIHIGKGTGFRIASYDYTYDGNDNRTKVRDHTGKLISYTYDAKNQVLSETDPVTGNTIFYTYDLVGNRKTKVVKTPSGDVVSSSSYQYNAGNQLVNVDGQAYSYTLQGNLKNDGEKTYKWDPLGRLIEVKKGDILLARYEYDEDGRRIQSTVNGQVTNFVYDGDSIQVLYETNASNQVTKLYTYSATGLLLSMTKPEIGTYYYHTNAHGDVIAVTDDQNTTVARYTYDAWGNILEQSGAFAEENPYRYAGYHFDQETGFYYLMARHYNPRNGNFISVDPHPGTEDLETQNGYNYCHNNPVIGIDPDGHFVQFIFGAAIGGVSSYLIYHTEVALGIREYNKNHLFASVAVGATLGAVSGGVSGLLKASGMTGRVAVWRFQVDYVKQCGRVKKTAMLYGVNSQTQTSSWGDQAKSFYRDPGSYYKKKILPALKGCVKTVQNLCTKAVNYCAKTVQGCFSTVKSWFGF